MTTLVDESIIELRANHGRLREVVERLSEDQLTGPSGAREWSVADVLSHLGSGAEIGWHQVAAAVGRENGGRPENQEVWDRWSAMSPAEQGTSFLAADERLVSLYEGLTPEERSSATIDLGFLPAPTPLAVPLAMRLSEQTLHGWDIRVGVDPAASLSDAAADLLLQHHAASMSFLLGFVGKADMLDQPVRLAIAEYTLVIDGSVHLEAGTNDATATYAGQPEAAVRLLAGRLDPERTPEGTEVHGNTSLEDLRKVFQGY